MNQGQTPKSVRTRTYFRWTLTALIFGISTYLTSPSTWSSPFNYSHCTDEQDSSIADAEGLVVKNISVYDIYDCTDFLIKELIKQNVTYYLGAGSALGAVRVGGIMDHDKDIDMFVVNASEYQIETALEESLSAGALRWWGFNNDGKGPGEGGFGYHVNFPRTSLYLDIWMMTESNHVVKCTGRLGGCMRWFNKHTKGGLHEYSHDLIFPTRSLPFGTKYFEFPNLIMNYLDEKFPNWQIICGGWQKGTRRCTYEEIAFFVEHYDEDGKFRIIPKFGGFWR